MPLVVLALAVAADYAKVSRISGAAFNCAADAASVAVGGGGRATAGYATTTTALAGQVADVVFIDHAPHGAGTPTVDVKSSAAAVTATVGYAGLAPSNFGSAFGYDAVSVDASSTSLRARRRFPVAGGPLLTREDAWTGIEPTKDCVCRLSRR